MSDEELLTPEEAAGILKISVEAFYKWRRRRGIPNRMPSDGHGRLVRVRRSDLVAAPSDEPVTIRDFYLLGQRTAARVSRRA